MIHSYGNLIIHETGKRKKEKKRRNEEKTDLRVREGAEKTERKEWKRDFRPYN